MKYVIYKKYEYKNIKTINMKNMKYVKICSILCLTGFLSGFWPKGVEMRCNGFLGGQRCIIFLKAKHMAN